jgi:hypothetical protein
MYGVERSVVALTREVGVVDGMAMLEVKGNEGADGVGIVELRFGSVIFGKSHAVCCSLLIPSPPVITDKNTYLIRIDLKLHPQYRVRDVVDQVRSAHSAPTADIEAPASIRVVEIPNRTCRSSDDYSQVGKVLNCGRSNYCRHEDDAREEHGGRQ